MSNKLSYLIVLSVFADILLALILVYISVVNNQIIQKYYSLENKVDTISGILSQWELDQ